MLKDLKYLHKKRDREEKITMLSCYDYPTARWAEAVGADIILVGDSLGVNMLGYETPQQVTMNDMVHHFKAVRRAVQECFLIADLPSSSSHDFEKSLDDSKRLLDFGADAIKIETFDLKIIRHLLDNYIEVCFDMIFPLAQQQFGGAKDDADLLIDIIKMAMELQKDGLALFVLTMFPEEAAKEATELLSVPVIGVGSGRFTGGQGLIAAEMLGICGAHGDGYYNQRFADFERLGRSAMEEFIRATTAGEFPGPANCRKLSESEIEKLTHAFENTAPMDAL